MERDNADSAIIEALKENSRLSYMELGRRAGLSEAAVRRRVKNLVKDKIIKKFTLEVQEATAHAFTLIAVNPSTPTYEISGKIKSIKGVERVYEITGQYDIIAFVGGLTIAEVNSHIEEIRKTDGVIRTNTVIILREIV